MASKTKATETKRKNKVKKQARKRKNALKNKGSTVTAKVLFKD
jgi:hypothetical protein